MTSARPTAALVLAGGRSSRFGRDKLVEPIDGRPVLERAIDAVRPLVGEILVVVAPDAVLALPVDARPVRDARAFEGPLAGVAAGLVATDADVVLVVGGDMPSMVPAVLARLLAAVEVSDGPDAAVLAAGVDRRPLPMAVRRRVVVAAADALVTSGERRLRAVLDVVETAVIPERDWRLDDPEGLTLVDVDRPEDLSRISAEAPSRAPHDSQS